MLTFNAFSHNCLHLKLALNVTDLSKCKMSIKLKAYFCHPTSHYVSVK